MLSVTNHAPHTKYCKNIITERRVRTSMGLAWGWSVFGGWPYDNARGGEWEIGRRGEFLISVAWRDLPLPSSRSDYRLGSAELLILLLQPFEQFDRAADFGFLAVRFFGDFAFDRERARRSRSSSAS